MSSFVPTAAALRLMAPTSLVGLGLRGAGKTTLVERLCALPPTDAWGLLATGAPASGAVLFAPGAPPRGLPADPDDEAGERLAWLLGVLDAVRVALPEGPPAPAWLDGAPPSRRDATAEALTWLDQVHAHLVATGRALVLLYDEPPAPLGALLKIWLILGDRYRRLRARVLLRPERLAGARLSRAEQQTVLARSIELLWSDEELLRALNADGGQETHEVFGAVPKAPSELGDLAARLGLDTTEPEEALDALLRSVRGRRGQRSVGALVSLTAGQDAATVHAEAFRGLVEDLPAAAALQNFALPAPEDALAEALGSERLALLRREAVLTPTDEGLELAPLYTGASSD